MNTNNLQAGVRFAIGGVLSALALQASSANREIMLGSGEVICIYDEPGTYQFRAPVDAQARILIVGGGGGGGDAIGGGGGGGAVIELKAFEISAGQSYALTVGAGGAGATSSTYIGQPGGASVFNGISAGGGGGGGGYFGNTTVNGANAGGSPGNSSSIKKGTSTEYYTGYNGAKGINTHAGGGAGAAGDGYPGTNTVDGCGGIGGPGVYSDISDAGVYYGCGGGGGSHNSGNKNLLGGPGGNGGINGGNGGSGNGTSASTAGVNGTGTGGGGGGWGSTRVGASGGCGTVIIRYSSFGYDDPHIIYECEDARFATNGVAHTISIPTVKFPLSGATIGYSTSESGPFVADRPTFTEYGVHSVWFRISASGLPDVIGCAKVLNMAVARFETAGDFQFTPSAMLEADVLLVGGGGAGGALGGGGGGGAVVVRENVRLTRGVTYAGTVGAGGTGKNTWFLGESGGTTSFLGMDAPGGGGGGSWQDNVGGKGANGGGGARGYSGGKAVASFWFTGYGGGKSNGYYPAGGGGANGAGQPGSKANGGSGNGGDGIPNDFTGTIRYYGCGGGGGSQWSWLSEAEKLPAGKGGNDGINHGNGATHTTGFTSDCHGDDGTGTGGGGGYSDKSGNGNTYGGNGGSGAVIIRYIENPDASLPAFDDLPAMSLISGGHARFTGSVASFGEGSATCSVRFYLSDNPNIITPCSEAVPVESEGDDFAFVTGVLKEDRIYYGQVELINAAGKSVRSLMLYLSTPPLLPASMTGIQGDYEVTAVSNAGTRYWFKAPATCRYDLLVVGGGGAGGGYIGAGGGGGGVASRKVYLTAGECYELCVGGGAKTVGSITTVASCGESSFFDDVEVLGGGGGGNGYGGQYPGLDGASGGGCAASDKDGKGTFFGKGVSGQGFDGGMAVPKKVPGGGGGSAGIGGAASVDGSIGQSGAGGDGYLSRITGAPVYYGCGGGGGGATTNNITISAYVTIAMVTVKLSDVYPGLGGSGGVSGGNGGVACSNGSPGLAGTGCGGGGGGGFNAKGTPVSGGAGGDGIVVLRRRAKQGIIVIFR